MAGPIQQIAGSNGGATPTLPLTLGSVPTQGNILIATVATAGTGAVTSIVQTNVTWTLITGARSAVNFTTEIWVGVVGASAGTLVTMTPSATANKAMNVSEWAYSSTSDVTPVTNSGSSTSPSTGTITTVSPNTLLIAALHLNNQTPSLGPTAPFVALTVDNAQTSAHLNPAYLEVASPAGNSAGWTTTTNTWDTVIVALQGLGAASVAAPITHAPLVLRLQGTKVQPFIGTGQPPYIPSAPAVLSPQPKPVVYRTSQRQYRAARVRHRPIIVKSTVQSVRPVKPVLKLADRRRYRQARARRKPIITRSQVTPRQSPTTINLTLSGNETTDAVRVTSTIGDGRAPESTVGIWEETTNLENSAGADVSFESGTTGYTTGGTNTIASDAGQAKFGTKSCKATYQDNATLLDIALTLTANEHNATRWVYIPSAYDGGGITVQFANYVGATGTLTGVADMSKRDQWQRVSTGRAVIVAGDLVGNIQVINTGAAPTAGRFIYIDGAQTEQQPNWTPFAIAPRIGSRVQAPSNLFTPTQGWIAFRLRPNWDATIAPSGFPFLFHWSDSGPEELGAYFDAGSLKWLLRRHTAGAGTDALTAAQSFTPGTDTTVVCAWTSTQISISVNGAAFVNAANTNIPALTSTQFDIGRQMLSSALYADSDFYWVATGKGTLSDADASTINSFGNPDPILDAFPGTPSLVWPANTASAGISSDSARSFRITGSTAPVGRPLGPVLRTVDKSYRYARARRKPFIGRSKVTPLQTFRTQDFRIVGDFLEPTKALVHLASRRAYLRSRGRHKPVILRSKVTPLQSNRTQDFRITASQGDSTTVDFRITAISQRAASPTTIKLASRRQYRQARGRRKPIIFRSAVTPLQVSRTQDFRIQGSQGDSKTQDFRITGDFIEPTKAIVHIASRRPYLTSRRRRKPLVLRSKVTPLGTSRTQDIRITAQLTDSTTQDFRIVGFIDTPPTRALVHQASRRQYRAARIRHKPFIGRPASEININQSHYRLRNDDGDEATATWMAAVDTPATVLSDTIFRLRFALVETHGGQGTPSFKVLVRRNGGSWGSILPANTSGGIVQMAQPAGFGGTPFTTQQISSGTFGVGQAGAINVFSNTFTPLKTTEYEFGLRLNHNGGGAANGDVFDFRVVYSVTSGATPVLDTYGVPFASVTLYVPTKPRVLALPQVQRRPFRSARQRRKPIILRAPISIFQTSITQGFRIVGDFIEPTKSVVHLASRRPYRAARLRHKPLILRSKVTALQTFRTQDFRITGDFIEPTKALIRTASRRPYLKSRARRKPIIFRSQVAPLQVSRTQDLRIQGQATDSKTQDFRIVGDFIEPTKPLIHPASRRPYRVARLRRKPLILRAKVTPLQTNRTQDIRITAQLTDSKTQDIRLTGQQFSPQTIQLTASGNEVTDITRTVNTEGDGRGTGLVTNLTYKNYNGDPVLNGALLNGASRVSLGGGKYRITASGGGGNPSIRIYAALSDLTNGATYASSVYYENLTGGTLGLDWCDSAATTTAQVQGRASIVASRATYDSTYRFFDITVDPGQSVDLYSAQVEVGAEVHPYVGSATPLPTVGDSSYGIWMAATNLVTYGGFESWTSGVPNGYTKSVNATVTQVAGKFGTSACQFTTTDPGNGNTGSLQFGSALPALASSTQYTFSMWVRRISGTGTLNIAVDSVSGTCLTTSTISTDWVRVTNTLTTGGAGPYTTGRIWLNTAGDVFEIDGLQIEQSNVATPYIHTNGSTATRNAARVQGPSGYINGTQSWVALRFRAGMPVPPPTGTSQRIFDWRGSGNNLLASSMDSPATAFTVYRGDGSGLGSHTGSAQSFVAGDYVTVIYAWDAGNLKLSVNGAAFTSSANTKAPSGLPSTFDIASFTNSSHLNGDVMWFAAGSGTLSDANAATIHAFGNLDPILDAFPGTPTLVWPANTTSAGILSDSARSFRIVGDQQPGTKPSVHKASRKPYRISRARHKPLILRAQVTPRQSFRTQDLRITAQLTDTQTQDFRITGQLTDTKTQDFRIVGDFIQPTKPLVHKASTRPYRVARARHKPVIFRAKVTPLQTTRTQDLRIQGQATDAKTQDFRITGAYAGTLPLIHLASRRPYQIARRRRKPIIRRSTVTVQSIAVTQDFRITGAYGGTLPSIHKASRKPYRIARLRRKPLILRSKAFPLVITVTQDLRITGTATDSKTQDFRIVGQLTDFKTQDFRVVGDFLEPTKAIVHLASRRQYRRARGRRRPLILRAQVTPRQTTRTQDIRLTGQQFSPQTIQLTTSGNEVTDRSTPRYHDDIMATNPTGFWFLDEPSGNALDQTGNALTGTYVGGVTRQVSGPIQDSLAAEFNGTTGYVDLGTPAALNAIASTWSLEAWVYPTAPRTVNPAGIITKEYNGGQQLVPFSLAYDGNAPFVGWYTLATGWHRVYGPTLPQLTWTHLVGTWDGTSVRIYVNGALYDTLVVAGPVPSPNTLHTFIGRRWDFVDPANDCFPGRIAKPAIYTGVLTSTQIASRYSRYQTAMREDGRIADSSYGIWESTTNLILNGGFETNLTGWGTLGSSYGAVESLTRITTDSKFGVGCAQLDISTAGVGGDLGMYTVANDNGGLPLADDSAYATSVWLKAPVGKSIFVRTVRSTTTTNSGANWGGRDYVTSVTATGAWQRLTVAVPSSAGFGTQSLVIRAGLREAGTVAGDWIRVDGFQLEQKLIATPYVHTNGATATRPIARVQAPSTLLNPTQGWVAMRMRMGWASTVNRYGDILHWADDPNNRLYLYTGGGSSAWFFDRRANPNVDSVTVSSSYAAGDFKTVVIKWTATTVAISVDGVPFTSAASTHIPTLAAPLFDIGSGGSIVFGEVLDSDVFWFACGTGTLTDADAATINSLGNFDPIVDALPGSPTMVWPANTISAGILSDSARSFRIVGDQQPGTKALIHRASRKPYRLSRLRRKPLVLRSKAFPIQIFKTQDLRIQGQLTNATTQDFRLTGQLTDSKTQDVRLTGQQFSPTSIQLTATGNEITDITRLTNTEGDGRGTNPLTNLAYKNSGGDPVLNGALLSGATRTPLGGGKYRLTASAGGGGEVLRVYASLSDLTNGATYTSSVYYENLTGGTPLSLDWCDSAPATASGLQGRASITASRSTYDSTYRFFDINIGASQSVDVYSAQIEAGFEVHPYVGAAIPRPTVGDSSYGIWEATTNLVTNGSFETNTAGWADYVNRGAILSRDTTQAKFGTASLKVITPGSGTGYEGASYDLNGLTPGTTYTFSMWLRGSGTFQMFRNQGPQASTSTITLTNTWTRYSLTFAAVGTVDTVLVCTNGTVQATTFWIDGVQVEQKTIATPYVHTDGATATRGAAKIDAPPTAITVGQGWVALRVRVGASSANMVNGARAFDARTAVGGNVADIRWQTSGSVWNFHGGTVATNIADSFNEGDYRTLIVYWTNSNNTGGASVNGSPFQVFGTGISTDVTFFTLGAFQSAVAQFNGEILWAAAGIGTLTDANAATIHAFGNADPVFDAFPGTPTLVWGANTPAATVTSDPSRYFRLTGQLTSFTTLNLRVTGQLTDTKTQDVRVTGQLTSTKTQDLRITGTAQDAKTQDLRVTGQLTNATTQTLRVVGQDTTTTTQSFRILGALYVATTLALSIVGIPRRPPHTHARGVTRGGNTAQGSIRDTRNTGDIRLGSGGGIRSVRTRGRIRGGS